MSRAIPWLIALAATASLPQPSIAAEDTAGLKTRPGRRPLKLWPPPEGEDPTTRAPVTIEGWRYEAVKAASPRDGVPWHLVVTPVGSNAEIWKRGPLPRNLAMPAALRVEAQSRTSQPPTPEIPAIEIPEVLWRERMDAELQGVVGIHFHELVSDDVARLMLTIHQAPHDASGGSDAADSASGECAGTRLEATLLAPVVWSLDQCIVVRDDNLTEPDKQKRSRQVQNRIDHEIGHAGVSRDVMLAALQGPQDWNRQSFAGRRSTIEYYWRREIIGRRWVGYERGAGELKTLRTSIALVPPTRWSKMLPIPPERVTPKHIERFNDEIVRLGDLFAEVDRVAQERFHAQHGSYEDPGRR